MSSLKYSLGLSDFTKNLNFFERLSKQTQNIKFLKNPTSGSGVGPCGRTQGRTDVKKLTVSFSNFTNLLAKEISSNLATQMSFKHDIKIQVSPYKSSFYCH